MPFQRLLNSVDVYFDECVIQKNNEEILHLKESFLIFLTTVDHKLLCIQQHTHKKTCHTFPSNYLKSCITTEIKCSFITMNMITSSNVEFLGISSPLYYLLRT